MFSFGPIALAFVAGLLSILSPCVLPILPIALGGAVAAHRFGPFALAAGLALSFTGIGLLVATLGLSIGINGATFQMAGAALMVALGVVLMAPSLQARFASAAAPIGNWVQDRFTGFSPSGLSGQFALGVLFGAIWSPCAGPTLGAAALLAASGHDLSQASVVMFVFGIGASLPLLLLATVSRASFQRWRTWLGGSSAGGKVVLGSILVVFGGLILTGLNQPIETALVTHSPDWLLQLTSRY